MSNFCTLPLPPFFCLSEWIRIGQDLPPPAPGQDLTPPPRLWARPPPLPPRPWLKIRLTTTPPPTPTPFTPIPFGILAAYRLYLADVSIRYHARATQNSLQLKININ